MRTFDEKILPFRFSAKYAEAVLCASVEEKLPTDEGNLELLEEKEAPMIIADAEQEERRD